MENAVARHGKFVSGKYTVRTGLFLKMSCTLSLTNAFFYWLADVSLKIKIFRRFSLWYCTCGNLIEMGGDGDGDGDVLEGAPPFAC
jgi:hypothetical protein